MMQEAMMQEAIPSKLHEESCAPRATGGGGLRSQVEELEHRCVFAPLIPLIGVNSWWQGDENHAPSLTSSSWIPQAPLSYGETVLSAELGSPVADLFEAKEGLLEFSPEEFPHHDAIRLSNNTLVSFWSSANNLDPGIWMTFDADGQRFIEKIATPSPSRDANDRSSSGDDSTDLNVLPHKVLDQVVALQNLLVPTDVLLKSSR